MGYYLYPLYVSYKNLKSDSNNILLFSSIIFTMLITFLVAGLTNSLFHDIQVMDLWIIILTLYFITTRDNNELNNSSELDRKTT